MKRWSDNDELFFGQLVKGHMYEYIPAVYFACAGLTVRVGGLSVRGDIAWAWAWSDQTDMLVQGVPVEVKSRSVRFTSPTDYPYPSAFIDTVSGYDAKPVKPVAYVLVSQVTGAMLCTPSDRVYSHWGVELARDSVRGIRDRFYTCPRGYLRTMDKLVGFIRNLEVVPLTDPGDG